MYGAGRVRQRGHGDAALVANCKVITINIVAGRPSVSVIVMVLTIYASGAQDVTELNGLATF